MRVTRTSDRRLTVASWNLHEGVPSSGVLDAPSPHTVEEVVALLAERDVDIAAFQEVGFDGRGHSEVLDAVRKNTALRHVAAHPLHDSSFFPGRRSGVAVVSRFPVRDYRHYMLPNPRLHIHVDDKEIHSHDKGLVRATIALGHTELDVASLHALPFYLFQRAPDEADFKEIWDALSDELHRHVESRPLLVCGDFNTEDRRLVLNLDNPPLVSSLEGRHTYRGRSVDDILYAPGISLVGIETIDNFSDHRACVASFRMPPRPLQKAPQRT
ncbi:endonuclease/exonuclease/phosphatase family protein [Streptomyces sp. NA02950]|uniref:endonuclease/exonuclease/phosphatase family protein n=1 Tax=Streptomyces sp. NA02950 TaxID=2742137 RepID=UPI00158FBEE6|nr:endonuclease/exonuclease/phosphatase family protein [Streptomyces sp. NA02950]QKV92861.1 endonuclease/exonuclease/phosphatase family protein [Streptomyces sp. NA02950]